MPQLSDTEKETFECSDNVSEHSSDAESIGPTDEEDEDEHSVSESYESDDSFVVDNDEEENSKSDEESEEEVKETKQEPSSKPKVAVTAKKLKLTPVSSAKKQTPRKSKTVSKPAALSQPKPKEEKKPELKKEKEKVSFAEFSTDSNKTCRSFKKSCNYDFEVVREGKVLESVGEASELFAQNLDYSIVRNKPTDSLFRAVCVQASDGKLYAVLTAVTFDNLAVQKCMNKQTAVRKTEAMCQYSLDTSTEIPPSLAKYKERLGLDDGGIFFSTENAKTYLTKVKQTDTKKRKATAAVAIDDSDSEPEESAPKEKEIKVQVKKPRVENSEKLTFYEKCKVIGDHIVDDTNKETVADALAFIERYVNFVDEKTKMEALGISL